MRVALVVWIALVSSIGVARADDAVGVVVTSGSAESQAAVWQFVEDWLRSHGHAIAASPLNEDAITSIANCLLIDDQHCARGVVDARSKATSLVYAHVEVATAGTRTLTFTAYWFVKGHEAVAERRICENCTEDSWHGVLDEMLETLSRTGAARTGHLKIDSNPAGMIVQFDNEEIGITPLQRDVSAGPHRVVLTHLGRKVGARKVEVAANDTTEVVIDADLAPAHASRLGPAALLLTGIVALGVGTVFMYYGSLGGPEQKYTYGDSTPIGIGFLAVGLGATIGGSILLAQTGPSSGPVASITPTGGYVGWVAQF